MPTASTPRAVLQPHRLVHVMRDEPPQTGIGLVQLLGERAGGQAAGQLHRPRPEQEREPAARPRPRDGNRPHPVHGTRDARHTGADERLVPEEARMPPHALPPAVARVTEVHGPHLPKETATAGQR